MGGDCITFIHVIDSVTEFSKYTSIVAAAKSGTTTSADSLFRYKFLLTYSP